MMCLGAFFMGNSLNSVKEYSLLPPLTFNLYEIDPAPAPDRICTFLVLNRRVLRPRRVDLSEKVLQIERIERIEASKTGRLGAIRSQIENVKTPNLP